MRYVNSHKNGDKSVTEIFAKEMANRSTSKSGNSFMRQKEVRRVSRIPEEDICCGKRCLFQKN